MHSIKERNGFIELFLSNLSKCTELLSLLNKIIEYCQKHSSLKHKLLQPNSHKNQQHEHQYWSQTRRLAVHCKLKSCKITMTKTVCAWRAFGEGPVSSFPDWKAKLIIMQIFVCDFLREKTISFLILFKVQLTSISGFLQSSSSVFIQTGSVAGNRIE